MSAPRHRAAVAAFFLSSLLLAEVTAFAEVDARMLRYPAVSADRIAFVYAGDIWLVPKKGGTAVRLSSPAGEESFPRFSPDGSRIAYSAAYDGNTDVYVVAGRRRRTGSANLPPDAGPRDRMDTRRQARALRLGPRKRQAALQPVLHRGARWRPPRETAGALRRVRHVFAGRHPVRLHAAVAGLPHVEALPRRLGAGPVALRSQDLRIAQPHERPRKRRAADVAREDPLFPVGPRRATSATTSGRTTSPAARPGRSHSSTTSTSPSRPSGPTRSCSRPEAGSTSSISPPRSRLRSRFGSSPTSPP